MGTARGRPRKSDPEEVLETAVKLFWERGYEGTSMNDLACATGMAKPGLYATFGDKEALYGKALARYFERGEPRFDAVLNAGAPLRETVRSYLETVAESLNDKTTPYGCFLVNSLVDCAGQPPALESLGRDFQKQRRAALVKRFRAAQKEGDLSAEADPKALAEFYAGQALTLGLLHRSGADKRDLKRFIEVAMTALPAG